MPPLLEALPDSPLYLKLPHAMRTFLFIKLERDQEHAQLSTVRPGLGLSPHGISPRHGLGVKTYCELVEKEEASRAKGPHQV